MQVKGYYATTVTVGTIRTVETPSITHFHKNSVP